MPEHGRTPDKNFNTLGGHGDECFGTVAACCPIPSSLLSHPQHCLLGPAQRASSHATYLMDEIARHSLRTGWRHTHAHLSWLWAVAPCPRYAHRDFAVLQNLRVRLGTPVPSGGVASLQVRPVWAISWSAPHAAYQIGDQCSLAARVKGHLDERIQACWTHCVLTRKDADGIFLQKGNEMR